ncbi:hypothetical protein N8I71_15740 [Roseibacterium sp. SDUM158016]|uniref:hypothetical protein n=1 Tax=Roseicyclus sediminis TaxID=2980997 RepID=UPI0021D3A88C|nr:hypothetical protein [Roseibacterium sp. SDUM158016]MCU4654294.1 hypothetical protein [Roseibacterium sp. SDUM158016]
MLRAFAFVFVLSTPVAAEVHAWDGADDPGFAAAREDWLSGSDDMAALARLADLAAAGNLAAQVLLGTVVAAGLVPEAVDALPRAERIALTRAPGGLSGTSWLRVAGQADPVAGALETVTVGSQQATPAEMLAALETLLAAGETGPSMRIMTGLYNIGGFGPTGGWTVTALLGGHSTLQGHGAPLLSGLRDILTDPSTGVSDRMALAAVKAALAALPRTDDLDAPLAAVCAAGCPATAEACTEALVQATGGLPGFLTLSPVEGLVDSATYQSSPRFAADLRRRLSAAADSVAGRDACAATLIR